MFNNIVSLPLSPAGFSSECLHVQTVQERSGLWNMWQNLLSVVRVSLPWKGCLYPCFAGVGYRMSTTFLFPFPLKLPFRWGDLPVFPNGKRLGDMHILLRSVTLYMKENSWKSCLNKFWAMRTLPWCQLQHDFISDLFFISVSHTELIFCVRVTPM